MVDIIEVEFIILFWFIFYAIAAYDSHVVPLSYDKFTVSNEHLSTAIWLKKYAILPFIVFIIVYYVFR
ncbi:hypothetical protein DCO56_27470 [Sphingobacterium athyrii]|uniref:Uncharacterized protein n=1 Tax=Sphingobacterium athyrii TaxID=2152717 RepID=A0A363NLM5_9SPHI|nr:hypothetical protein DCO56_27470 [Sphingobacterium athyrii]